MRWGYNYQEVANMCSKRFLKHDLRRREDWMEGEGGLGRALVFFNEGSIS